MIILEIVCLTFGILLLTAGAFAFGYFVLGPLIFGKD